MKFTFYILYGLTFCLIILTGCDDTAKGIDDVTIPSSNVSFAKYIQPLFIAKCADSGCHDTETDADGIDLSTWVGATNPEIVVAGNPDNSKLVWTIERLPGVSAMPPLGYAALTSNQITGIKTWIKEGAKNN
jgi:Planctomycete cytochrome C